MSILALLLQLIGIAALVAGIALIYVPAAVIVGGLGVMAFGLTLESAASKKGASS